MTEHLLETKIAPPVSANSGLHGRVQPIAANPGSHPAFALHAGQRVLHQSEKVGTVRLLLTSPHRTVRSFVLHPDRRAEREVIVPLSWVETADRQQVHLKGERAALGQLPTYVADNVLAAAVERALSAAKVVNDGRYNDFAVSVREGAVLLRGHVLRTGVKQQVEQIASQIRGVLGVDNQLVADNELESEVAQALTHTALTYQERVFVNARHGIIHLSGKVSSAALRDAAEQCAAKIAHVRAVVNLLEAPPTAVAAEETRVLQPRIGQEVIGKDLSLGKVDNVIISPRNRRVSAIVVHGRFPDWSQVTRRMLPEDMPRAERRVVVPLSAIRHVNQYDVLLGITGVEAAHLPEFDPALYATAGASWLPPYPYQAADVMLEPLEAPAA